MGNTRDYYADLELPPTADVQDIKKQFRKLALKYHPDRNPGREQEVNSQFQIIQTAHEVLTDTQQKAKFDATLARAGRSSGVKGNPWSNAGQNFPPPPKRNQPNRTPAAGGGAQRWSQRFASGVPPTAKQQTASEAEKKKNAARAFDNMRKNPPQTKPNPPPREARGPVPPVPPRTETGRQRAEASFGNRKSGFTPRSSMPGDEPPVTAKNYSSRVNTDRPYPPQTQSRRPQQQPMPDPLNQFRDNGKDNYIDPRISTPYTTHGGEKTNPFDGISINRAKSNRERSRRDGSDGGGENSSGHRSSSVPKNAAGKDNSAPGLSVPDNDQRPHTADETGTYTKATFQDPASDKYNPGSGASAAGATDAPFEPNGSSSDSRM